MEVRTERFREIAQVEMKDQRAQAFLGLLPPVIAQMRKMVMASFPDPDAAQELSEAIRAEVVANLPELLEEFERNAERNGAKVVWARDAKEANAFIVNLAREKGVSYVSKGKSMVTEETGLNHELQAAGIEPFETDLGEFIAQQLKRPPFHIVGPAINVPPEEIRDIFMEKAGLEQPTVDPVELGYAARLFLRDKFHHLQMGITGVNMAVAATGTIINVENEGNIRMTKSSPKTLVSVMSLEKVVPTMADALHLMRMLCRNCTGQKMSSYVSLDSGPKRPEEIDGPEELYVVIVDNGRSDIYQDTAAREVLRCIRCGACLNICPVYAKIGGYPYGFAYSGPMGQVLNPLLLGLKRTQDLYRACTLCGACKSVCPGGLDHPSLYLYYRSKDVEGDVGMQTKNRPLAERLVMQLVTFGMNHSWAWNLGVKLVRPFFNHEAAGGFLTRAPVSLAAGWFCCRDLPAIPSQTFHERWKNLKG